MLTAGAHEIAGHDLDSGGARFLGSWWAGGGPARSKRDFLGGGEPCDKHGAYWFDGLEMLTKPAAAPCGLSMAASAARRTAGGTGGLSPQRPGALRDAGRWRAWEREGGTAGAGVECERYGPASTAVDVQPHGEHGARCPASARGRRGPVAGG
jgi:hypothetical protein